MASAPRIKTAELDDFHKLLSRIGSRLRGDLSQLSEQVNQRSGAEGASNLSKLPIHLADLGSENYEQEFTMGLIENEQATLEEVESALARIAAGTFGRCEECDKPIAKARLQAIPYARHCIECARAIEAGESPSLA